MPDVVAQISWILRTEQVRIFAVVQEKRKLGRGVDGVEVFYGVCVGREAGSERTWLPSCPYRDEN